MNSESENYLRAKKEFYHVQMRKNKQNEIFRQKRQVNLKYEGKEEQSYRELCELDIESLHKKLEEIMIETKNMYVELPHSANMIVKNLLLIKPFQIMEKDVYQLLIRQDFIRFLVTFLRQQFDGYVHLQQAALNIVSNFVGQNFSDRHRDKYFLSYRKLLEIISKDLQMSCLRFLEGNNKALRELFEALLTFGNFFLEANGQQIYEFLDQNGLAILKRITVNKEHYGYVAWILSVWFQDVNPLDLRSNLCCVEILDLIILNTGDHESLANCMTVLEKMTMRYPDEGLKRSDSGRDILELFQKILNMGGLKKVIALLEDDIDLELKTKTVSFICNLFQYEENKNLQALLRETRLLAIFQVNLSSFNNIIKQQTLWALSNMCTISEEWIERIISDGMLEKIMSSGYVSDNRVVKEVMHLLIALMESGSQRQVRRVVSYKGMMVVEVVMRQLKCNNDQVIRAALEAVECLMDLGQDEVYHEFAKRGMTRYLENFQYFEEPYIRETSGKVLEFLKEAFD